MTKKIENENENTKNNKQNDDIDSSKIWVDVLVTKLQIWNLELWKEKLAM